MSTESRELLTESPQAVQPTAAVLASQPKTRVLLPALLTAALLWLCHFPANQAWLAWVALVPLVCLVRSPAGPFKIYLCAWIAGLTFYYPTLQWLRLADARVVSGPLRVGHLTWSALAIHCSLFFPLAVWLLRRLDRRTRLPLIVTLPVVWTFVEYLRGHLLTGFPWYFLGHTQHGFLHLIQVSDLGGAYAVSILVAAGNAVFFELFATRAWFRSFFRLPEQPSRSLWPQGAVLVLGVGAACIYGAVRLGQEDFTDGPTLALIQGNLDQQLRNAAATTDEEWDAAADEMYDHYKKLSDAAAGQSPDLIVWPETSFTGDWCEVPPGCPDFESLALARGAARKWQTNVLLGLNTSVQRQGVAEALALVGGSASTPGSLSWGALALSGRPLERYNSAILLRNNGTPGERYDKIHRVPFGEFVPLRETLSWLAILAPYEYSYTVHPGERLTRFALPMAGQSPPAVFGVLICFEDTDPYLARQYVRPDDTSSLADRLTRTLASGMYDHVRPGKTPEPSVDFLINISNDGWFQGSSEHDEHLAICRFRAVECRRSVARSVNMGISAVIDGSGRVVALPGPTWAGSKKMSAVLTATIPLDRRDSLYARWGDWLPALCGLVVLAGLVGSLFGKSSPHTEE